MESTPYFGYLSQTSVDKGTKYFFEKAKYVRNSNLTNLLKRQVSVEAYGFHTQLPIRSTIRFNERIVNNIQEKK